MTTLILEKEPTAEQVECTAEALVVHLTDGRTVSVPLEWYPRLAFATPEERANYELVVDGWGIHWPDLDEDLHVEGILAGKPSGEGAYSLERWKQEMRRRRKEGITGPWASANRATYEAHDYPPETPENE